jgi:glutaredoxin 3
MANYTKVTVYSTTTCAYCPMVKKWLDNKGISYEAINLDERPELREEVVRKSGATTVPITLIEQASGLESVVIGYNLSRLAGALGI